MTTETESRRLSVVLFDGFELLDVFGPLEIFGALSDRIEIEMVGATKGAVRSAQGPRVIADRGYHEAGQPAIVMVPGGVGSRRLVEDDAFLQWLSGWASSAEFVTSVCTGSGVLAKAGLLDGYRATSNKRNFDWPKSQSDLVDWVPQARWVVDRNRWTSSGVAAGIDMSIALVAHLYGDEIATNLADRIEFEWHRDPSRDPFAVKNGLEPG
jgi:transcriptional regulator GlxA family with amidase domain